MVKKNMKYSVEKILNMVQKYEILCIKILNIVQKKINIVQKILNIVQKNINYSAK